MIDIVFDLKLVNGKLMSFTVVPSGFCVDIYKEFSIWYDDVELYPFVVKEFLDIHELHNNFVCRFKTLAAAKAAITKFLKS